MANADLSAILDALRAIRNNQTILQDGLAGVIRRLNRVETAEEQKYVAAPIWRTSAVNAAGLSFDSSPTMTRKYSFRMPQFRDFSIPDLGNSFAASTSLANPQESRPYMRQHNYSQSTLGDTTGFVNEDISLLLPSPEKAPVDDVQLNGGFTAWSQVFVSFLLVFNGFGYFSSFGLFQSHWIELLHASPSDIAWVGSMMLFLLFFLGILSGPLMDRGHFRSILFIGCTFQVLGAFSTSGVTQYWQLILAQGVVQGIGNGMLFTPCVALVSIYFTKNRAFALSLAACGAPIGGIVFPLISRQLSGRIGYPWTIRIMGFIMLFNTVLILTLGRPRKFKKDKRSLLDPSAFKEPVYLFYAIGIFFTLWGLYIAYFYTSTYGKTVIGLSESDSLTLLLVLNVAGLPGRLIPAFLADRFFGPFNTMLPFVMGSAIMLLVWMRVDSTGGFYAFVVLYGICANAVQTLFPSTLSSLVKDPSKMGQRVGMVFGVGSLACLTGPPLAGVLIGVGGGSYVYMQLFGGLSIMVGFVFLGISRFCQMKGR